MEATAIAKTVSLSSVAPQARVESRVSVSVVGISLSFSLRLGLSLTLAVVTSKTRVAVASISKSIADAGVTTAVAKTVSTVAPQAISTVDSGVAVAIVRVSLGLSLSSGNCRKTEQDSKLEHLSCLAGKKRIPM